MSYVRGENLREFVIKKVIHREERKELERIHRKKRAQKRKVLSLFISCPLQKGRVSYLYRYVQNLLTLLVNS